MASSLRPVPLLPHGDAPYDAPFHEAVQRLVSAHGAAVRLPPSAAARGWSAWTLPLAWPPGAPTLLPPPPRLYVVREGVDEGEEEGAVCDQCRIMGKGRREKEGGY